jgi:hypothetical protein
VTAVDLWHYRAALDVKPDLSPEYADGDTVALIQDRGGDVRSAERIRLLDVKAPERGQLGYHECRSYVLDFVATAPLFGRSRWPLLVRTIPNSNPEPDEIQSLVRYVGEVWHIDRYDGRNATPGRHLNSELRAFLALHPEWPSGN